MARILWLQGLEPGVNQGDDVDSYRRYIYIHGTSEEDSIGTPASHGCIRMRNRDVIELYDLVDIDCAVLIEP
jgi:lipoprotein-anchoring transpeptidase ErfK/SrfK